MESQNATSAVLADGARSSDARGREGVRVSLIIPCLNEARRLPTLLARIEAQTRKPDEIIVADAHSTDGTRELAESHGCRVVDGGMPAVGRNAGARAATGDILVFMDADAEPETDTLAKALDEFELRHLDAATAPLRGSEGETFEVWFWCVVAETYIRALQHVAPHAVGLFIVVRRSVHERIGGFDETLVLAEDHEYARRANAAGKFGILRDVRVRTSMRRAHHEGRAKLWRIFLYSELRTLRGIPIREIPFKYEFGAFVPETQVYTLGAATRRYWHILTKPSTEIQTDALFGAAVSVLLGVIGITAAVLAGMASYAIVLGLAAAASTWLWGWVALRKLKFERHYGDFFMASVAIADVDIYDNDGRLIVRKGVDEMCEVHAIGSLDRMAELNKQGTVGRLRIGEETIAGIRAMIDDFDDPFYDKVGYVIGYSNLTGVLFKMGFSEIDRPPALDAINRFYKPIMTRNLSKRMGHDLNDDVSAYRMAIASRDFVKGELAGKLDAQLARVRRNIERAQRSGRATVPAGAAPEAAGEVIAEPAE